MSIHHQKPQKLLSYSLVQNRTEHEYAKPKIEKHVVYCKYSSHEKHHPYAPTYMLISDLSNTIFIHIRSCPYITPSVIEGGLVRDKTMLYNMVGVGGIFVINYNCKGVSKDKLQLIKYGMG